MKKTDLEKLFAFDRIESGDVALDEYGFYDPKTKEVKAICWAQEGDNGKYHGQKGHRKAYLSFNFTTDGDLIDVSVYVPSIGENFKFLE